MKRKSLKLDDTREQKDRRDESEYCCSRMKDVMRDASFAMLYYPQHDEIYLDSREGDDFRWHFEFCPFCGKDIEGKSEILRKVIGEEFGINTELDDFDWDLLDQLPPEFQTDEWWKKRGL